MIGFVHCGFGVACEPDVSATRASLIGLLFAAGVAKFFGGLEGEIDLANTVGIDQGGVFGELAGIERLAEFIFENPGERLDFA